MKCCSGKAASPKPLSASAPCVDVAAGFERGPRADYFAENLSLGQHSRTYLQGCLCTTGFAGGGCCPGGASSLALQSGCGSHAAMGWTSGAFGLLGLYGSKQVLTGSTDAIANIKRVRAHVAPQIDRLALLQAEAAQAGLPHRCIDHRLEALRVFEGSAKAALAEQHFNFAVPGVVQALAAASAIGVAAAHVGIIALSPAIGTWLGVAAPALFAAYGLLLAGKHAAASWRGPARLPAALPQQSMQQDSYGRAVQNYTQLRQASCARTALAWGLVGAVGAAGALASAGVGALPLGPWAWFAASLGAAGFAMWQNSQTRFVPHLPVSPHVSADGVSTSQERQLAATILAQQDQAIQAVGPALLNNAAWQVRAAHLYERAFAPQCGPRANQVAAQVMQRASAAGHPAAGPMTGHVLEASITWCAKEIQLVTQRWDAARGRQQADQQDALAAEAPPCKRVRARKQAAPLASSGFARTPQARIGGFARDEQEPRTHALGVQLQALIRLHAQLQRLRDCSLDELSRPVTNVEAQSPAQTWLWARLELLLLSGTLADAVGPDFIKAHPDLFSQLAPPEVLPVDNVYVLPSKIGAFAQAMAPRIDGAFVHGFCNPHRIEKELDYLFELELAAPAQPEAPAEAPAYRGTTCCDR